MNVPKLRFKEFDGEWEINLLKDIAKINPKSEALDDRFEYIDLEAVSNGLLINSKIIDKIQAPSRAQRVVSKNDILYQTVRPYQKNNLFIDFENKNLQIVASTGYAQIRTDNKIDAKWLYQAINTSKFTHNVLLKCTGTSYPAINSSDLGEIEVKFPELKEQLKIGLFFEKIDKKIQLQQQKIDLLQEQKKGYMQKIFNQEIRFKDEKVEYPEWQNKSIDEVAKIIMGQSPDSKAYSEDPANTVLVQGNADLKNGKIVPRIYTSQLTKICEIGDIILTVRAPVGIVAKCNIPACIGRGVCAIKADDFLFYYLDYYNMTSQWAKLSQGSTFESVNSNDIKNIVVPQPCEEEKMKISKFFKRLMERIQLEEAKLLELKLQKQGFMQQLFV